MISAVKLSHLTVGVGQCISQLWLLWWLILGGSWTGLIHRQIAGKTLFYFQWFSRHWAHLSSAGRKAQMVWHLVRTIGCSQCVCEGVFKDGWYLRWWTEWGSSVFIVVEHHPISWGIQMEQKAEGRQIYILCPRWRHFSFCPCMSKKGPNLWAVWLTPVGP